MKTKKILSLLVVFTLALSMLTLGNVQAAEDEFAILRTLGINTDFSDDTTPITRYQLAQIALELTGNSPDAEGEPTYPDVPAKHKFFPIVNAVTKNGLMGALSNGAFGAETNASIMDGGRVLLSELGYTAFGVQAGWTDAQYASKVQSLGLTSGIDSSKGLTYNAIGRMMVNMLTTKTMEIVSVSSEGIQFAESDDTYVESKYGYLIKTGVFQANGEASMAGFAKVKNSEAVIDGALYKTNGNDYSDFVGYNVKIILTSAVDGEIIHVEKYSGFEELVIPAERINSYNNYKYYFLDENDKQEMVSFNTNARVIINGQNAADYNADYFKPDHGTVTLIDTEGDDVYDVVNINTMIYYKVGGTTAVSIADAWTGESFKTDEERTFVYSKGAPTDIMQLEPGSYAEISAGAVKFEEVNGNKIMKLDFDNSKLFTINVVDTTTVRGEITSRKVNALGIDGVMYEINPFYQDLIDSQYIDAPILGSTVTLVLNAKGQIIDVTDIVTDYANSEVPKKYAYMIGAVEARGETGQAIIKTIDLDTLEEKSYFTAKDCKINGKKFEYKDCVKIDTSTNTTFILPDGNFKHQLIKLAVNDADEITELYLAVDHSHQYIKKHIRPLSFVDYIPNGKTERSRNYVDYYLSVGVDSSGKNIFIPNPDYDDYYSGYDNNNFSLDKSGFPSARHVIDGLYEVTPDTLQIQIRVNKGVDGSGTALGNNDAGHYDAYAVVQDTKQWKILKGAQVKNDNILMGQSMTTADNWNYIELFDVSEKFVPEVAIKYIPALPASADAPIVGASIAGDYNANGRTAYVTDVKTVFDEEDGTEKTMISVVRATTDSILKEDLLPSGKILENSRLNRRKVEGYTFELDEATYGKVDNAADDYMLTASEYTARSWDDIQVGDIIQTTKNTAGKVAGFRIVCEAAIIADADNVQPGRVYRTSWTDEVGYVSYNIGYVIKTNGVDGSLVNLGGPRGSFSGLRYLAKLNPVPGGSNSIKGAAMIIHTRSKMCESATLSDVKVGDNVLIHMNNGVWVEAYIIRP